MTRMVVLVTQITVTQVFMVEVTSEPIRGREVTDVNTLE